MPTLELIPGDEGVEILLGARDMLTVAHFKAQTTAQGSAEVGARVKGDIRRVGNVFHVGRLTETTAHSAEQVGGHAVALPVLPIGEKMVGQPHSRGYVSRLKIHSSERAFVVGIGGVQGPIV